MQENVKLEIMKTKTIKRDYKITPFKITKDNIDNFKIMENRRQISEGHVRQIHGALLAGKNPLGVIIVNIRNKEMRLIDGNHRIEAVKRFYAYKKTYKEMTIECILKVFEDLSDEEERHVYADEAKRRDESYEDRLNMYKDAITFWKLLQGEIKTVGEFPCKVSIYASKNSIKFRLLLNSLFTIKNESPKGYYPKYLRKDDLVPFAMELSFEDYKLIGEFIVFFQEVFGLVSQDNMYCVAQYFIPLFDIYVKNRMMKDDKNFKDRFSRIIGRADLIQYVRSSGRESQTKIRAIMLGYMNYATSRNKFI